MLEIKNLEVTFSTEMGKTKAVKDFSFDINSNEIVAVVGESGSGKSVCALSIVGLYKTQGAEITNGTITFEGKTIDYNNDAELQSLRGSQIAYIFQEPMTSLNPLHTIKKQLIEHSVYIDGKSKIESEKRAIELLSLCGIKNPEKRINDYPHNFSGGERQRIMIALAIINNPKLLIADEPTTALDVTVQKQILELLIELKEKLNMSILLISHDLNLVKKYANRVAVVQKGLVVEFNTNNEIFNNPKEEYTKHLINQEYGTPVVNPSNKVVLDVENMVVEYKLKKKFLKKQTYFSAVKGIEFSLKEGDCLGIVGESGSGKTSLVKGLLHLIDFRGNISLLGNDFTNVSGKTLRNMRRDIQIVFQDPFGSLNPRMTAAMIISEGLRAFGERDETVINKKIDDILVKIGFSTSVKHKYPHEFSGGERQRIAIARAVIMQPKIIILDEPTSSLDKNVQQNILNILRDLQKEFNISYIFISHDLHVIKSMCNNIIVMKEGEVVERGTSEEIINAPKNDYTKELISAAFEYV